MSVGINEYIICEGFDKYGEFGSYPDTDKTEEDYTMKCLVGVLQKRC